MYWYIIYTTLSGYFFRFNPRPSQGNREPVFSGATLV